MRNSRSQYERRVSSFFPPSRNCFQSSIIETGRSPGRRRCSEISPFVGRNTHTKFNLELTRRKIKTPDQHAFAFHTPLTDHCPQLRPRRPPSNPTYTSLDSARNRFSLFHSSLSLPTPTSFYFPRFPFPLCPPLPLPLLAPPVLGFCTRMEASSNNFSSNSMSCNKN